MSRDQLGLAIDPNHLVPGAGKRERDPPRAAAELEHGAGCRFSQLAPQRQISPIAAALDVVPDGRLAHGRRGCGSHRQ